MVLNNDRIYDIVINVKRPNDKKSHNNDKNEGRSRYV